MAPRYRILAVVLPVVVVLDLLTKWLIRINFRLGETMDLIPPVFGLTHVHNPGAAFSFMADAPGYIREPFFFLVPLLALIFLGVTLKNLDDRHRVAALGISLVVGGAIGNLIDRLRFGYVVDFLDVHWKEVHHWPRFNVADCAIVIGVVLLLLPRKEFGPP